MGAPTLLDTQVPGVVTAAWLEKFSASAGRPVLLGYLEWDVADGLAPDQLRVYRVEATGEDSSPVRMELPGGALQ